MGELDILRGYKVVKANELIQRSRFSLSAQEQKIVLYIISKIKPNDTELEEQQFNIVDFCRICGLDGDSGGNYKYIKSTLKGLRDKSVWITLDDGRETTVSWVSKAYINKNSGTIAVRLDDDMKPYLIQLHEKFTQYELIYTLAMRSQYSIRLYELLRSYESRRKITFEIDELKMSLCAEKYVNFKDFRIKVLEIALREIESFSDISVDYELIKVGRKVTKVEFVIRKKAAPERLLCLENINEKISTNA